MESELVSGPVTAGLESSLPVQGVLFITGNDLAGGRVSDNPQMVHEPITERNAEQLEKEIPNAFPSCVVTHSKSWKRSEESGEKGCGLRTHAHFRRKFYGPGQ